MPIPKNKSLVFQERGLFRLPVSSRMISSSKHNPLQFVVSLSKTATFMYRITVRLLFSKITSPGWNTRKTFQQGHLFFAIQCLAALSISITSVGEMVVLIFLFLLSMLFVSPTGTNHQARVFECNVFPEPASSDQTKNNFE